MSYNRTVVRNLGEVTNRMRSRDEFIAKLGQQITWLERSAAGYDAGEVDEALRMSVPLRVLFHDTPNSTSLLTHLGVKRSTQVLSTSTPVSPTAEFWAGITSLRFGLKPAFAEYIPKLDAAELSRPISVHEWWSNEIVYVIQSENIKVQRRDLVLWAANKEGGAHVDPNVPKAYRWMEDGAGWSITINPNGGPSKVLNFENAHLAALRQITYEVLNSPAIRNLAVNSTIVDSVH